MYRDATFPQRELARCHGPQFEGILPPGGIATPDGEVESLIESHDESGYVLRVMTEVSIHLHDDVRPELVYGMAHPTHVSTPQAFFLPEDQVQG